MYTILRKKYPFLEPLKQNTILFAVQPITGLSTFKEAGPIGIITDRYSSNLFPW